MAGNCSSLKDLNAHFSHKILAQEISEQAQIIHILQISTGY